MDHLEYANRRFPGYELILSVVAKKLYEGSKVLNTNIDNERIGI